MLLTQTRIRDYRPIVNSGDNRVGNRMVVTIFDEAACSTDITKLKR